MKKIILKRFAYTPMGTFGSMQMPDGTEIFTVEDSWRDNAPNVSCIPNGTYKCCPRFYNRGSYQAIHIAGVIGRSHILFHRGNTEDDVQGCVVTGMKLGFINNRWAVADSRGAFDILMNHYGDKEFDLEVIQYDPINDSYSMDGVSASAFNKYEDEDSQLTVLQKMGVLISESVDYKMEYLDDIIEPEDEIDFDDYGVQWHEDIGYTSMNDDSSYRFFSRKPSIQFDSDGKAMCTLMAMPNGGFLNMATELGPNSATLESLREKLSQLNEKDQSSIILSEKDLTVIAVRLYLGDRSGTSELLMKAKSSGVSPHVTIFTLQLTQQDFPLVNAALAGEKDILILDYEVRLDFPKTIMGSLELNQIEFLAQIAERGISMEYWNLDQIIELIEELIDAQQIQLSLPSETATQSEIEQLRTVLINNLVDWTSEELGAQQSDDVALENVIESLKLEQSLEIKNTVIVNFRSDASEWGVGGI